MSDELELRQMAYNAGRESMREELASVELQLAVEKTHVNLLKAGLEREESEVSALRASLQSMREELKFCDAEKQSARRVSRKMIEERDEAIRNRDHWREAAKRRWETGESFRQQRDEAVGLLREFAYRTAETDLGLEDRAKAFLVGLVR